MPVLDIHLTVCTCIDVLNEEFNFRHDWNSLISDNPNLRMTHYSDKYFPDADDMVAMSVVALYSCNNFAGAIFERLCC